MCVCVCLVTVGPSPLAQFTVSLCPCVPALLHYGAALGSVQVPVDRGVRHGGGPLPQRSNGSRRPVRSNLASTTHAVSS